MVSLPFRVFDKTQTVQPGEIVENKRLGAALALVKQMQDAYPHQRKRHHPARQRPPNNLEAPGLPTKSRPSRAVLAAIAADTAKQATPAQTAPYPPLWVPAPPPPDSMAVAEAGQLPTAGCYPAEP